MNKELQLAVVQLGEYLDLDDAELVASFRVLCEQAKVDMSWLEEEFPELFQERASENDD